MIEVGEPKHRAAMQGLDFFGAMLAASRAAAWNYLTICCMAGSPD